MIPKLFHDKRGDDQVRVCVVGCASGEEAYSIGILLCEYAATLDHFPKIQIFATDIDERGLDAARKGRYPESISEHVSAQRLERFFIKQDGLFQVKRELRELCIFSSHSFIKDPPYSRLDLISCRNVMIYLGPNLQQKVLPLFQYALRSGGYLFLGPSENASAHRELFRAIDKKHAIFQRKESLPRPGVRFPLTEVGRPKRSNESQSGLEQRTLPKQLEGVILQRYAPACVVVKESGEAVYFSGQISRYLEQPTGRPEANVINMARDGLRIALRTSLHRAVTAHQRIVQKQISVQATGAAGYIDLTVEPLPEFSEANLYMIVLAEVAAGPEQGNAIPESGAQETIRSLESELRLAKEQAQSAYEEQETSNEELQSANEEYQSTNQELETSKEELQSFNEELETVNAELNRKVAELDLANSDLQNLLNSTQIAAIFLDADLNIRNFTPVAGNMFRLIASDVGRPITDLAAQFTDVDLVQDAKGVLATLSPCERAVSAPGGRHYQKRILPYRTVHNVIAGVVLTFVDVTLVKQAEQIAKEAQAYAESIVDTVREPLVVLDANLRVKSASKAFFETFKGAPNETLTKSLFELGNRQWDIPDLRLLLAELLTIDTKIEDYQVEHEFLSLGRRTMLLNARRLQQGEGDETLLLLAIEDITDRKLAVEAIRESERRRRELVEALPIAVYTTDANGLVTMFNRAAVEFAGRVPVLGAESWCVSWKMYWPDGTPLPHDQCPMAVALKERRPIHGVEGIVERPDGTLVNFIAYPTPLYDDLGNLTGAVNMVLDITERKAIDLEHLELLARERAFAAERALQAAQSELAHVVRALTVGELATSIAHEVNQPLAAIVTNAEACLRWLSGEPNLHEAEESLALIVRDGNRASEVIRRIREFLKKDRLLTTELDINEVIEEAIALGSAELLKWQVILRVELSSELSLVQGDRIQFQQVILNLIMNGREAMASVVDRPRELVVTSQGSEDEGIVVAVRDSGAGIEPQKLDRMFDAFFTTKPTGLGMGLSISRSIIEAHSGRIWATLNDGPGLTVRFSVPVENENPA